MGKDKQWAVGGEKPDWMDVAAALRAVDAIHLGKTMVSISAQGIGSSGGIAVVISTLWEVLNGSRHRDLVTTERLWTGHLESELPAFVLGGIYHHDFACGQSYQQRTFPT